MKRAIFNLMKNAVQAMDDGGVITIQAAAAGAGVVRIDVVDTGPGIEADVRRRLFEPFFTTREKGSGLGLAIVQQAVERNRGRLQLSSIPGKGTTVSLVLPSKRPHISDEVGEEFLAEPASVERGIG
jgi:signal transduction histidine kinase